MSLAKLLITYCSRDYESRLFIESPFQDRHSKYLMANGSNMKNVKYNEGLLPACILQNFEDAACDGRF
jgi:hypothetical protein